MKTFYLLFASFLFISISCTTDKEPPSDPIPEVVEKPIPVYLTPDIMCGTVQFTDGCGPAVDSLISFGLALIHHMTYDDAEMVFNQVIKTDPDCFWGHWGRAMTFIHPLWPDAPNDDRLRLGMVLSQRAMAMAQKENEKLYGQALVDYYENGLDKTEKERITAFYKGWEKAYNERPDDLEAQLFHALTILATVSPTDKTYEGQKKAGALAEQALEVIPDHPGGFHYAIHAYDFPPLADKAIRVASNYSKIAPEIPHALHMPTHIFTRLGIWDDCIEMNVRSAKAAWNQPAGDNISLHYLHALDYLVYAHLQKAEESTAKSIAEKIKKIEGNFQVHAGSAYALAAIPARLTIENKLWKEASEIDVMHRDNFQWEKFPQFEALVHFAKGIGAGRSNNASTANQAAQKLGELMEILGNTPSTAYWYNQMAIQKKAVEAFVKYAEGNKIEALAIMQVAAEMESKTEKNPITPGEIIQVRELLGDLLLELDKPAEALLAYQHALEHSPNKFNTLYGAGKSAKLAGDMEQAKVYFKQVMELKGENASNRKQLADASKNI